MIPVFVAVITVILGPAIVLLVGKLLNRKFDTVRQENSEQHAAGQALLSKLASSHLTLIDKVDHVATVVTEHISDHQRDSNDRFQDSPPHPSGRRVRDGIRIAA